MYILQISAAKVEKYLDYANVSDIFYENNVESCANQIFVVILRVDVRLIKVSSESFFGGRTAIWSLNY